MKLRIIVVVIFVLLLLPANTSAKTIDQWQSLDRISDEALQFVKLERYDNAKQMLEYFSNEFLHLTIQNRPFSMDDLRIITVSHNNALKAVTSTSMPHEERIRMVTQFRLAVDAMHSKHQPLWTAMESSIMTTFNQMKINLENGNQQHFHQQLNIFLNKYDVIEPSIKIDVSPDEFQKLDAHINFLNNDKYQSFDKQTRLQQLNQMEKELKSLFDEMNDDEADPSLIWVMISTGSFIILTLSYVGWRKYKGDKQKRESKKRLND